MPDVDPWEEYNKTFSGDQQAGPDPWEEYYKTFPDEPLTKQISGQNTQAAQGALTGEFSTGPIYSSPEEDTRPLGPVKSFAQGFVPHIASLARTPADYVRAVQMGAGGDSPDVTGMNIAKLASKYAPPGTLEPTRYPGEDLSPPGLTDKLIQDLGAPASAIQGLTPRGIPQDVTIGNVPVPTGTGSKMMGGISGGIVEIGAKIAAAQMAGIQNPATTVGAYEGAKDAILSGDDPIKGAAAGAAQFEAMGRAAHTGPLTRAAVGGAALAVPAIAQGAPTSSVLEQGITGAALGGGLGEAGERPEVTTDLTPGPLLDSILGRQFGAGERYGGKPLDQGDLAALNLWATATPQERLAATLRPGEAPVAVSYPGTAESASTGLTAAPETQPQAQPGAIAPPQESSPGVNPVMDSTLRGAKIPDEEIAAMNPWQKRAAQKVISAHINAVFDPNNPEPPQFDPDGMLANARRAAAETVDPRQAARAEEPILPAVEAKEPQWGTTPTAEEITSSERLAALRNPLVAHDVLARGESPKGMSNQIRAEAEARNKGIPGLIEGTPEAKPVTPERPVAVSGGQVREIAPDFTDVASSTTPKVGPELVKAGIIRPGQMAVATDTMGGDEVAAKVAMGEAQERARGQGLSENQVLDRGNAAYARARGGDTPHGPINRPEGDPDFWKYAEDTGRVQDGFKIVDMDMDRWRKDKDPNAVEGVNGHASAGVPGDVIGIDKVIPPDQRPEIEAHELAEAKAMRDNPNLSYPEAHAKYGNVAERLVREQRLSGSPEQPSSAVGEQPAAPRGPGAQVAGPAEDPRAQLEQLGDTLSGMKETSYPPSNFPEQPKIPLKDRMLEASAIAKTMGGRVYKAYTGRADFSEGDKAIGLWDGRNQITASLASDFAEKLNDAVTDPITRRAIARWIDTGGDKDLLTYARDNGARTTDPKLRAVYDRALNLKGPELILAQNVKNYYSAILSRAKELGVLDSGKTDYMTHIWNTKRQGKEIPSGGGRGGGAVNPTKAQVFDHFHQGEDLGYRGNDDLGFLLTTYEKAMQRRISDAMLRQDLLKSESRDGRPLAVQSESSPLGYVPAKSGTVLSGLQLHPEIGRRLNNAFGASGVREQPAGRALLDFQKNVKDTMTMLNPFHGSQLGFHALEHRVNLAKTFLDPQRFDPHNPDDYGLITHGFYHLGTPDSANFYGEGLAGSGGYLGKIPGVAKTASAWQRGMWKLAGQMKLDMARDALARNRERYGGDLTPDQIFKLTADQANAAFGGQNLAFLGRNKTWTDFTRLAAFAPDFLESRAKFVGQAAKGYGKEQRTALLLGAATMYGAARIANAALNGGDAKWEPNNAFSVVVNGKSYSLRTIQGDLLHLIEDPRSFAYNRLNPVFARPLAEAAFGRDEYGRQVTPLRVAATTAAGWLPIPVQTAAREVPRIVRGEPATEGYGIWPGLVKGFLQSGGVQSHKYDDPAMTILKKSRQAVPANYSNERLQSLRYMNDIRSRLRQSGVLAQNGDQEGAERERRAAQSTVETARQRRIITDKDINTINSDWHKDSQLRAFEEEHDWRTAANAFKHGTPAQRKLWLPAMNQKVSSEIAKNPNDAQWRSDILSEFQRRFSD